MYKSLTKEAFVVNLSTVNKLYYFPGHDLISGQEVTLGRLPLACVASVSSRVRRESWDEGKKKRKDGGVTRLETLATQASLPLIFL